TLFDVEQIEVLRGPQGTRYGANALAGLIYVKTKEPSNEPAYQLQTLWGNDGDRALGFSATGALNDKGSAAYRFSLQQFNANGFRYNDYYDINDSNQKDEFVSRGKIKWQASDDLTLDLTVLLADINNGFDTFNPENTFITHSDNLGRDEQRSVGLGLRTNWTGAKNFDLISISSSTLSDVLYFFDGDWGNDDYWAEFAPYDFTSRNRRNRKNISQEFRLVSKADARIFNDSSDWIVGLYLLDLTEDNQFNDFFNDAVARDLNSEFNALSSAIFAQIDSH
ncbi:MAG: TonB-dependent receptor, partial [Proteobacteria bacterium]|nr:TonB-dependent receptor [Pseudomonadota bacterium]